MSKQLSGAQKRKLNKRKLEESKSLSQQFVKWLRKEDDEPAQETKSSTVLKDY
jgi:hypothetical protein